MLIQQNNDQTSRALAQPSFSVSCFAALRDQTQGDNTQVTVCVPSLVLLSEEESQYFASQMFPPGLLVIHDSTRRGQHDVAELPGWQKVAHPRLSVLELDVEAGTDDAALVQPAVEEDHNLARTVVVHNLELPDVTVLHHDREKFDDDF